MRSTHTILALVFGLIMFSLGCAETIEGPEPDETETIQSELRIPGPWTMPQATANKAAMQFVPVVDPPPVSPRGSCTSSNAFACSCSHPECSPAHPGTKALDQYLRQRFNYSRAGGLYCCRQNSARTSVPKLSVHAVGRAIDLMIPLEGGDANNGLGDPIANWLVENAEFIGIQRVIWDRAYWNGERGYGHLSTSSSAHVDHLHIELSHAGAAMQTPFFTTGAHTGSCTPRCEGTRIINADCSSGDCGYYGAVCTPGNPPQCTVPPPPEPAEAEPVAGAPMPVAAPGGDPGRINFIDPIRVFDTRTTSPSLQRGDGSRSGPLRSEGINTVEFGGLPEEANTVWLNVAAINSEEPGFLRLYPAGAGAPSTSSLNHQPGKVRANAIPVALSQDNQIAIDTRVDVNAVADMTAYFGPRGEGMDAINPTRVFDSRSTETPIRAESELQIDVRAPAGSTGVMAMVALINKGDAPGFVTAYPCGEERPEVSNINYQPNSVTANTVMSKLGNGKLCLWSKEEVDVVVDVNGYVSPTGPLSYQPIVPTRLLDTREENTFYKNRLAARQVIQVPIQELIGMPEGVWSAAVNLTAVGASNPGFLSAFPCGGSVPETSSLNFPPQDAVASLSVSRVGMNGNLCIFASSRAHVIVDIVGVWKHIDGLQPPAPPIVTNEGDQGDHPEIDTPTVSDMQDTTTDPQDAANKNAANGQGPELLQVDNGCTAVPSSRPAMPVILLGLILFGLGIRRRESR